MKAEQLNADPFRQFEEWYAEAIEAKVLMPDAMCLATADRSGRPSARMVLYKGLLRDRLLFHTNYLSPKSQQLLENPQAALTFYWPLMERQIRIEGKVAKAPEEVSDAYWKTRPRGSQLTSLASPQSQAIAHKEQLKQRLEMLEKEYEGKEVPRPAHWGGFALSPERFEFWLGGQYRFHDRVLYTLQKGEWLKQMLAP